MTLVSSVIRTGPGYRFLREMSCLPLAEVFVSFSDVGDGLPQDLRSKRTIHERDEVFFAVAASAGEQVANTALRCLRDVQLPLHHARIVTPPG